MHEILFSPKIKLMNYKFFFCILLFSISFPKKTLFAQSNSETFLEETGIWAGVYVKAKITNKIGYYAEHHLRLRNSIGDVNSFVGRTRQIYNRAGINIIFNKNFEAVFGPTLVLNYSTDKNNPEFQNVTYETRIWHQWLFKMNPIGGFIIYHQFRFEHRWKKSNLVTDINEYTNRYRYKLFAYIPLNSREIEVNTIFFSPSAEIFMHSGRSIVYNPFEDFRTYNGIGYVYNDNITFFAGHMWTIGQKNSGFEYRTSHILRFNVFIGLDFRKNENRIPEINLGY